VIKNKITPQFNFFARDNIMINLYSVQNKKSPDLRLKTVQLKYLIFTFTFSPLKENSEYIPEIRRIVSNTIRKSDYLVMRRLTLLYIVRFFDNIINILYSASR